MGFFKTLFTGKSDSPQETKQKNNDRNFDILKYDGIRALKIGKTSYAIRCFREALNIKSDIETISHLATALIQTNETEEACQVLNKGIETDPSQIKLLLQLAQVNELQQNFNLMDENCTKALALDRQNATVLYWAGKAKHAIHDDFQSIAFLTQAIQQDQNLQQAYQLRAEILRNMNSFKEAEEDADYLLNHFEPTEESLLLKADLCTKRNDLPEAISYYNKVKTLYPFLGEAYVKLSQVYSENHQLDQSLDTINEAIDLLPDYAEAYKERGRIKLLLNDKNGAMDDIKKSLECNPEEAANLNGSYTNIEQQMNDQYKNQNPYGF